MSFPGWWNEDTSAYVKVVLGAVALIVVLLDVRRRHRPSAFSPEQFSRAEPSRAGRPLQVLGCLAVLAYFNFGAFHFGGIRVHLWDMLHHYLGAKYIDELGYDGLYECIALADAADPRLAARAAERELTDLRTNRETTAADLLAHPERCRGRFSPPRWSAFAADVAFFRARFPDDDWQRVTTDHGFNASPVWVLLAHPLAGDSPVTQTRLAFLAAIDPVLVLGGLAALTWAFGPGPVALVAITWGTYFPGRFWWTGGSFLRWDWLAALLAGVALCRRGWTRTGGALLGYATLSRIFPGFAVAGAVLSLVGDALRRRRFDIGTTRVVSGALAMSLLLVPMASVGRRDHLWTDFSRNLAKHSSVASPNRMGVAVVVAFDPATRARVLQQQGRVSLRERWENAQAKTRRERRALSLLLAAAAVAAIGLGVAAQPAWAACVLGLILVPFFEPIACYYYALIATLALLAERRAEIGVIVVALAVISGIVSRFSVYAIDEQYAAQSVLAIVACSFIASYFVGHRSRGATEKSWVGTEGTNQAPPRPPTGPVPSPTEPPLPERPPTGP